jgi:hypothetical protein
MTTLTQTSLGKLLAFLERLEQAKIWHRQEHIRDSVMVTVAIPGEYWEVEFFEDGHVEVERYVSSGTIEGEDVLERLFAEDAEEERPER